MIPGISNQIILNAFSGSSSSDKKKITAEEASCVFRALYLAQFHEIVMGLWKNFRESQAQIEERKEEEREVKEIRRLHEIGQHRRTEQLGESIECAVAHRQAEAFNYTQKTHSEESHHLNFPV